MTSKENISIDQRRVIEQLSHFLGGLTVERSPITGSLNESVIIKRENGKRYVLQRNDLAKDDKTLLAEQRFLDYLITNGFPGVAAVKLGSLPFLKHDGKIYSLYPFIEGVGLNVDNPLHHERAYEAIGNFLYLSSHYDREADIWQGRWWNVMTYPFEQNLREYVELSANVAPIEGIYQESKHNLFSQLIIPARKGLYKAGIIHSDFRPEHFFFEGDTIRGIIDWTSTHYDVFVMEFARPFLYLCQSYEQRMALLEMINKHIKFSGEEKKAAFYSPLLLELTEFMWILRHKETLGDEVFRKELAIATECILAAYGVYKEVS